MGYFKTIDGCRIHYEIAKNLLPTTTVFLHGNLSSNRWWYPAIQLWSAKVDHNCKGDAILVEFRGAGKSDAPKSKQDINMYLFADDFLSLIMSLQLEKLNLVGHSTGGLIAAIMLGKKQNLFNKAFLLNSVGPDGYSISSKISSKFKSMKLNKKLTASIIGSVIYKNNYESHFFKDIVVEDAFISAKNNVCEYIFDSLVNIDVSELLSHVKNQTYVAHGEFDNLLPISSSLKLARCFLNGTFIKIQNQGHCTNIENPEKFVNLIDSYLFNGAAPCVI